MSLVCKACLHVVAEAVARWALPACSGAAPCLYYNSPIRLILVYYVVHYSSLVWTRPATRCLLFDLPRAVPARAINGRHGVMVCWRLDWSGAPSQDGGGGGNWFQH